MHNKHAVRSERWRYIRYQDGSEERYDYQQDLNEWNNVAADPKWREVKQKLAAWRQQVNAQMMQLNPKYHPSH